MTLPRKFRLIEVYWKLRTGDPMVASTRYRAVQPAIYCEDFGVKSSFIFGEVQPDWGSNFELIVFVKSFTAVDLEMARTAKRMGKRVIVDLCDDIFFWATEISNRENLMRSVKAADETERCDQMIKMAEAVIVTGNFLRRKLEHRFGGNLQIFVIPDGMARSDLFDRTVLALSKSKDKIGVGGKRSTVLIRLGNNIFLGLGKLIAKIRKRFGATDVGNCGLKFSSLPADEGANSLPKVLWFGNAGTSGVFGITDLLTIENDLKRTFDEYPFELVVLSSNRSLFDETIGKVGIHARFIQWSAEEQVKQLDSAKCVILPNSENEFSKAKSANRTITALLARVPVLASPTEALEPVGQFVFVKDWNKELLEVLKDCSPRTAKIELAITEVNRVWSDYSLSRRWLSAVSGDNLLKLTDNGP